MTTDKPYSNTANSNLAEIEVRESLRRLIDHLCTGPDSQLDECIKPRLQALRELPFSEAKDQLLGIIDDCVYASLCSDFVILVLNIMWKTLGGTEIESLQRLILLKNRENLPQLRLKYKWQVCYLD